MDAAYTCPTCGNAGSFAAPHTCPPPSTTTTANAIDFCPICAKHDYLTPDTPHHQDLFHADKSLSHVNFAAMTDRVRTLEKRIAALEEVDQDRDQDLELLRQVLGDLETNDSISRHNLRQLLLEVSALSVRLVSVEQDKPTK